MEQYVSTYSIIALYHYFEQEKYYLVTKSLIKSKTYLSRQATLREFQNALFFVEIQGNNLQFNVPIEYDQPVYFRHKISNKYLSLAMEQLEQKEIRYRLVLSSQKKYFTIKPCYQYQTKISTKIKFDEEIYLSTEFTESRQGTIVAQRFEGEMQMFLEFNVRSKLQFHQYNSYEKEEKYYKHGKIVWLSHIESDKFLSIANVNGKEEVAFEPIKLQKQIQSLSALWTVEATNLSQSNHLKFDEEIRFKNLISGHYLSFSRNYKLVDNERIYQIFLQENRGDYSKFMFKSIKDNEQKQISLNSYLFLYHYESSLFLGCRKEKLMHDCYKLLTFSFMEDEDLFKLNTFSPEEEQALRFVFAIRADFKEIQNVTKIPSKDLTLVQIREIQETYVNIKSEFNSLKKYEKLYEFVRNELGSSIKLIAGNLQFFRSLSNLQTTSPRNLKNEKLKQYSEKILKLAYNILCIFCKDQNQNQIISYGFLKNYIIDIGTDVGAEETVIETFRNNKTLLPKVGNNFYKDANLIRVILQQFLRKNPQKTVKYWINLQKIIQILNIVIFYRNQSLDINQFIISQELFKNGYYQKIFLPIQINGSKIVILDYQSGKFVPIESIQNKQVSQVVESILLLFSNLTNNHSFVSKVYINNYFSQKNQACLSIMIDYLNKPIKRGLYNQLLNFISKTYLDSSPRLKRIKPLSFIFFQFQPEKTYAEAEQSFISERLKQMMILKAEQSMVCKPLHYSNLLPAFDSTPQPSMSEQQLVVFRLNLTEILLSSREVSEQQLQTICLLMKLQCYTVNQMLQIYQQLKKKLIQGNLKSKLLPKILSIIDELYLLILQLQNKKLTLFLKYTFSQNKDLAQEYYKYVLPLSTRYHIPMVKGKQQLKKEERALLENTPNKGQTIIKDFNQLRDTLALMHAGKELKQILIKYFCESNDLPENEKVVFLESFFNLIIKAFLPKHQFLMLLSKSTILTHDEIQTFQQLFNTTKKLQYLILISDYWMVSHNDPENCKNFLKYLQVLNNFFYQDQSGASQEKPHTIKEESVKKQLFMSTLGVHRLILQLLQKNSYLVANIELKKDLPKKYKQIFQACFLFLLKFIRKCAENKKVLYEYFPILMLYQNTIQMGQLAIYTQFYRDEKNFIKQINFSFVENTIMKIIKIKSQNSKNQQCEYNPEYIDLIITMIQTLSEESKFFIQQFHNYISKPDIFHKLLFIEEKKETKEINFCLKMHKIKMEPLQLPILYHTKILELFYLMLNNSTQSIRNAFKLKLMQTFKLNYLFQVLTLPDILSNTGIEPQLHFIIKLKLFPIMLTFLDKNELLIQIYESEPLLQLLKFIYECLNNTKKSRPQITSESQSFFIPFIQKLGVDIFDYDKNKQHYFNSFIKPFLDKLNHIFQKHTEGKIKTYIELLQTTLEDQFRRKISKATTLVSTSLTDVKLKWRNFVDDDEDNSKEEKYVKKSILDILKSKSASKIINQELVTFYKMINKNSKNFISSMINLLKILFQSREILEGRKQQAKTAAKVLNYLSGYIQFYSKSEQESQKEQQVNQIIKTLQECKFIQIFIELTNNKEFQLRKVHLKNIFIYCLKILNFLLQYDKELKFSKLLLKIFKERPQTYKFLQFLQMGAKEIIGTIDPHSHLEQINTALDSMKLCIDKEPLLLYQQTYLTLTYLCKYEPFTQYLRNQQSAFVDIDFLDKIYSVLTFLFNHHNDQNHLMKLITVSNVRAAEQILDFVASMLTGANKSNQNYIIDNKFTHFVQNVLKIDDLKPIAYEFETPREELLHKIIDFYQSNGIDIQELLRSKISLIDFRHIYLLNRFKLVLVKTLLECLIANQNAFAKLRMDISIEIIKLNLIWVYQTYKKGHYEYLQQLILKQRMSWPSLVEKDIKIQSLFLKLGFCYFQLIELFQQKETENDSIENEDKIVNEEKEKERIVKKFFKVIKENTRQSQRQKLLESQSLREQMKYYYHTYYNALIFFKKKTGTIEVDLKGEIVKVYFPKLPITQKITEQMQQEFQIGVNRISREQKIKSLIDYENNFYEDIKGEQDYFNQIQAKMPLIGPFLRVMKYENQFLLAALINSFLICIQYLLVSYKSPEVYFQQGIFQYVNPATGQDSYFMLFLSIINMLIGIINGIYLFTRKIPLRKKLLSLKFQDMQLNQKDKKNTPKNQTAYVWSNILLQSIYNIYMIVFLILTMFHPFFSAFPLVDTITRIQMGRFIIRSMKETWSQLFVAIGLLIVFNIFALHIIYNFFTEAMGYGDMCKSQYTCMLLLTDQILKGGSAAIGNVDSDKIKNVITIQLLFEISYILIGVKVITQIFSGTIIDKFSELREEEENIYEDLNTICFICAQERFDLDLEYEGFTTHIEQNHQTFNYIKYLFYLRRQKPKEYGIIQRYITEQKLKESEKWIPEDNSVYKQNKLRKEKEQEQQQDIKQKVLFFCKEKMRDMKRIKQKVESMNKDLKKQTKQIM